MPRIKSHSKTSLVHDAMHCFWKNGYEATSLNDLVDATGVSRHGVYELFDGKRDLFLASLDAYQHHIVTPAFHSVEATNADFNTIRGYFNRQISLAEKMGLPGPGCLVANTMTESAPHDEDIAEKITHHNKRLKQGFKNVLGTAAKPGVSQKDINQLAEFIAINAQGLWSYSRSMTSAAPLRRYAKTLVDLVEGKLEE